MKISIITPSYNSSDFLEETIISIKKQSYQHYEHIVVDGQSTDNTIQILQKYSDLKWISEPDNGQTDAINKGFEIATGEILAWQNADDLYFPHTLEKVADFFTTHQDVDVVYGDYQLIDIEANIICSVNPIQWDQWLFAHGRFVPMQPTAFWRRRVYEAVGNLNESLYYCMDVDFFARASKQFKFAKIPDMLGQFRIHDKSKTHEPNIRRKLYKEHKLVLSQNFNFSLLDKLIFDLFFLRSRLAEFYLTRISPNLS